MSTELARVDKWLYGVLSADATIAANVGTRIYSDEAPQDADYPCIVFFFMGGRDLTNVSADRIFMKGLFAVKGIVKDSSYQGVSKTLADRIDIVLHKASGASDGMSVWSCKRLYPIRLVDYDQAIQYRQLGGIYEITAQGI